MIDIHCHLLPAIDDGSRSWEMTAAMCQVAVKDGITHIVCTPHANDNYAYDRSAHQATLEQLRQKAPGGLTFSLGCDFHLSFENIQQALETPDKFLISGSDYLLVEFSDYSMAPALGEAIKRFISMGITPIVTHPERNLMMQKRPEQVIRFAEIGCAIQVTANSLTGFWGDGARKMAHWLLEHECVHLIASDAHDPERRPPMLSAAREAVARDFGPAVADALVSDNPGAVVAGMPLPYYPHVHS
jgi:protein-tyrosine phosphatase